MGKRGSGSSPAGGRMPPARAEATPAVEIDALGGDPNFMTSLARGLAVIRAFSQQRRRQSIAEISRLTGIPRAAVRRCLYTLFRLGYVAADERYFSLQPKVLALGHAYLSSTPLAVSAQPFLDRVSRAAHESCSLAVLDGDEILYVARAATTTRIMSVDLSVGSRLPVYCTSMGRVLLANLASGELSALLSRVRLKPLTDRTVTSREKLLQILEGTRRAGYAVVDQELEIGLRSIAVPVSDAAGKVVAAMNVSAQAGRIAVREMEAQFLPLLRSAAAELDTLLLA
ncbi:MAG TPA: IclR family transcriptional regulator C-terminal domain-containing protein [Burkholderiales bacterium]|nr:IclR family transcriptional regulator C-terminal domain-containing protein [Burkholderiales bacterium]